MKQTTFESTNWKHRYSHGGRLRQVRAGRGARPLSSKESLHVVLKAHREVIGNGLRSHQRFALIQKVLKKYTVRFYIRLEQVSIQGDHIHLLIRTSRRSQFQYFFRVLSGQIAQRFENEGLLTVTDTPPGDARTTKKLWKYRPFSRIVKGWRAFQRRTAATMDLDPSKIHSLSLSNVLMVFLSFSTSKGFLI
jgi:putative transposase